MLSLWPMKYVFPTALCLMTIIALLLPNLLWAQAKGKVEDIAENEMDFFKEFDLEKNFFSNDTQLGAVITTGNVEQITVSGSTVTVFRVKRFQNKWTIGGYYDRTFFNSDDPLDPPETNAKYIFGTYRMDYYITQRTTFFVGGGGFSDQIKGIPLGANAFTGVAHYFIWTEKIVLNLAGGYQFVGEQRDPPDSDRKLNTVKVELTYKQNFNPIVSLSFNVDSLKDVTRLKQWLVDGNVEVKVKLYKILHLAVGFTVRFDNQPTIGFRKVDTITNLSLGVSFKN